MQQKNGKGEDEDTCDAYGEGEGDKFFLSDAKETSLMTKTLPDVPGKEGLIETVLLSPGEVVPAHQHNADVFAYVLDGSIIKIYYQHPVGEKAMRLVNAIAETYIEEGIRNKIRELTVSIFSLLLIHYYLTLFQIFFHAAGIQQWLRTNSLS